MKKIFILFVMVLVTVDVLPQDNRSVWSGKCVPWTRGEGTETSPYLIESAENLAFLSYMCASGYETFGLYFKLITDIDLNCSEGRPWNPIGAHLYYDYQTGCTTGYSMYRVFQGHFDGDGHCIYNLYSETNGGLFGVVNGSSGQHAVVQNVKVMSGVASEGGIAQRLINATVRRCANKADVVSEYGNAGGIAGESTQSCKIVECYNEGNINGVTAGGIVAAPRRSTISNCYNVGKVDGIENAGGCVGQSLNNEFSNCYNVGDVTCGGSYIGGLIGRASNNEIVENSYYLNTCGAMGVGTPKSSEEMLDMSFVNLLNNNTDVWGSDDAFENQGYPILKSNHTAVAEIAESGLLIYPNPANDILTVECDGITSIVIYDVLGQSVLSVAVNNAKTTLDISDLGAGVYIISVNDNSRMPLVTRFVVTR